MTGLSPHPALVRDFLRLNRFAAVAVVLKYKAKLIDKGLKEATINRRLAAIKSLVNFARKVGECEWSVVDVEPTFRTLNWHTHSWGGKEESIGR